MLEHADNDHNAARNQFLAACSLAGASTTAYRGGDRQECWLDIARLGLPDARAVLVLCCGLQGAEGYCGSNILTHWLNQGLYQAAPRDIGFILIHAILPVGMSAGGDTAPDDLADRDWTDNVLRAAARRFAKYARAKGLALEPTPTVSGGTDNRTAWLVGAFTAVAQEIAEHAERAGLIEFHTGMGRLGDVTVTSAHAAGGEADRRAMAWFGEAAGARNGGPAPLDSFALGFGGQSSGVKLTAAHVDFGVRSMQSILHLEARRSAAERHADIGGLFFPSSEAWRESMRVSGAEIISQALEGLAKS